MRLPPEILLPYRDPLGVIKNVWGFRGGIGVCNVAMAVRGKTFGVILFIFGVFSGKTGEVVDGVFCVGGLDEFLELRGG